MKIQLKRAYEEASPDDGARFLVDRLWPRGVTTKELQLTAWFKEVAPSSDLRRWFGHDPARWKEFRQRYLAELRSRSDALSPLYDALADGPVTLVYGAKDPDHNHALVLRDFLLEHSAPRKGSK